MARKDRHSVLVAGAGPAGLAAALFLRQRGVDVEVVDERWEAPDDDFHVILHPDVVEMEEVLASADGGGGVSIGALVRRTRRQNPSRVIVGEVLGPEVVEMLSAMSQGNDGSLSTIHARDAADVFHRLATYAAQHEGLTFEVSHALIGSTIDYVVFVRKNPRLRGRRSVMEVLEVTGAADGRVTRSRIFTEGSDGRAARDPEVAIMRWRALAEAGYDDTAWSGLTGAAPSWTGSG